MKNAVLILLSCLITQSAMAQFTSCRVEGIEVKMAGSKVSVNDQAIKSSSKKSKYGRLFTFRLNGKNISLDVYQLENGQGGVIESYLSVDGGKIRTIRCNGNNREPDLT